MLPDDNVVVKGHVAAKGVVKNFQNEKEDTFENLGDHGGATTECPQELS